MAKVIARRIQLSGRIEPQNHGRVGIDEIPRGDARLQRAGKPVGLNPIGNGQSAQHEHAERGQMIECPRLLIALDGRFELAQCPERITPQIQHFRVVRGGRNGARVVGERLVVALKSREHARAVAESRNMVGVDLDRLVEGRERVPGATELHEHNAAIDERIEAILLDGKRPVEVHERFVKSLQAQENAAAHAKRVEMVGPDGKQAVKGRQRVAEPIELHEGRAAVVERGGMMRRDDERLVEGRERLVMALEDVEDGAEVAQGVDRAGVDVQRVADQSHRLGALALLLAQDPEHMQGVEMAGPELENPGVKTFGFSEHSALMIRDRKVGGLRDSALVMPCR